MKEFNFSGPVLNLDGEPLKGSPLEKDKDVNIGSCIIEALLAQYVDEKNITGKDKLERFLLAKRIKETSEKVMLNAEEIVLIKSLVAKGYGPNVLGRVYEALGEIS